MPSGKAENPSPDIILVNRLQRPDIKNLFTYSFPVVEYVVFPSRSCIYMFNDLIFFSFSETQTYFLKSLAHGNITNLLN